MHLPVSLPLAQLAPLPEHFTHQSIFHGQAHVSRVMVHAFRLLAATGWLDEAPRLWAAVYLHDLARTHDGHCLRHGADAVRKLESMPEVRDLFRAGGVADADYAAVNTAVVQHCLPKELDRSHPHWRLTSLLKDADGLDRVRLGDLDPSYLRHPVSRDMVPFAQALYDDTNRRIVVGPGYFEALWASAARIAGDHGA